MGLKSAPLKVKVTKADGTSELRRLGFTFDDGLATSGQIRAEIEVEGYHLSLIRFLLRSLKDLYPDQPIGAFSNSAVFTVKDEDGDMVRFDSEEEFVAAMPGVHSWTACLRFEVTVLKAVHVEGQTSTPEASLVAASSAVKLEATSSASGGTGSEVMTPGADAAPSDSGSTVSFTSGRASSAASSSNSSSSSSTEAELQVNSLPATPSSSGGSSRSGVAITTPASVDPSPSTHAKAFLTQVLPGLADVLARSMYAAQWVPEILPKNSVSAEQVEKPQGPMDTTVAAPATAMAGEASTPVDAQSSESSPEDAAAVTISSPADGAKSAPPAMEASAEGSADSRAPSPSSDHEAPGKAIHVRIVCDGCDVSPIVGIRYKCAVRADFDLCENCEAEVGVDSPFPFVKIRTPAQAPAAIVCLLKPEQPASEEEASRAGHARRTGPVSQSYGPGQSWRSRRSPQRGGWGEGRRNCSRWMKDLARRQQQLGAGVGGVPPGVEFVRGVTPPWMGPRMQRRLEATKAARSSSQEEKPPAKAEASCRRNDIPTPPVSVDGSVEEASCENIADAGGKTKQPASVETERAGDEARADESKKPGYKAPTTTEATQGSDYHDMLAASMRSLASSMTTSLPASTAQAKGGSSTVEANKSPAKPMARFVTDVSVADGSPLPPNTRFVKTWCMRNDGEITFPPGCKLMPVGGDLMCGPSDGVVVEVRAPGEEFHVSVTLTTPALSGRYIGYWRLRTAEGQNFGHRIWADVLVTGGTAGLMAEGSVDGDWDLVNMQRLTNAVEGTAKNTDLAAADAAAFAVGVDPSTQGDHAGGHVTSEEERVHRAAPEEPVSDTQDSVSTPLASASNVSQAQAEGGMEETKSSDEPKEESAAAKTAQITPAAASKWHRELCSLAEMGFNDIARNMLLLEKHVVAPGNPGMERVLHELLSWHEVVFS